MPISTIGVYKLYTYTLYILIQTYNAIRIVSIYKVSANTGYTPIRRGCVYAYKLILFHGE